MYTRQSRASAGCSKKIQRCPPRLDFSSGWLDAVLLKLVLKLQQIHQSVLIIGVDATHLDLCVCGWIA
jgi:hypothetical protein